MLREASRFAAWLYSFRVREREYWPGLNRKPTTLNVVERASEVVGSNCVDLNNPDHVADNSETELIERMSGMGISLNGCAMRYFGGEALKIGAFTNPDAAVRRATIDLTKRGLDPPAAI